MGWPTTHDVIQQAGQELGLFSGDPGDPFSTSDGNVAQLLALLKRRGRLLVHENDWTHLRREFCVMPTGAAQLLPPDFHDMVDQSGWNRTTRLPLGGPASEQTWQFLKARQQGLVLNVIFKPQQGFIQLHPHSSGGSLNPYTLSFAYKSGHWVTRDPSKAYPPAWAPQTVYKVGDLVTSGAYAQSGFTKSVWRCVHAGASGPLVTGAVPGSLGFGQTVYTGPGSNIWINYALPFTSGTSNLTNRGGEVGFSGCVFEPTYLANSDGTAAIATSTVYDPTNYTQSSGCCWNWVGWVGDASTTQLNYTTDDAPTTQNDLCAFDFDLLVAGLKFDFLRAKRFEYSEEERDYKDILAALIGADTAAPKLDLNAGAGMVVDTPLGAKNFPWTGYGQSS